MESEASIVIDLGFGDSGKGGTVDFLTRQYESDLTIRFSGGSQCGHGVLGDQGYHVFSQFGSGSLAGARTLIGPDVYLNPYFLETEALCLSKLIGDPFKNLFISKFTPIITPYHVHANRKKEEARGANKHGSCGHGVWEAVSDYKRTPFKLTVEDIISNKNKALEDLEKISARLNDGKVLQGYKSNRDIINDYHRILSRAKIVSTDQMISIIKNASRPIFEGNQGIGLDERYGFYPYVTATDTTSRLASNILDLCRLWDVEVIGCLRSYSTRHGVGPFVTEDNSFEGLKGNERHNKTNQWQDGFRCGPLDLQLIQYGIQVDGNVNYLSLSHLDILEENFSDFKACYQYVDNVNFRSWDLAPDISHTEKGQEALTNRIKESFPLYASVASKNASDFIGSFLKKEIKVKSYGAKFDKKIMCL